MRDINNLFDACEEMEVTTRNPVSTKELIINTVRQYGGKVDEAAWGSYNPGYMMHALLYNTEIRSRLLTTGQSEQLDSICSTAYAKLHAPEPNTTNLVARKLGLSLL